MIIVGGESFFFDAGTDHHISHFCSSPRPIPVECRGETSVEEAVVLVRALFHAKLSKISKMFDFKF